MEEIIIYDRTFLLSVAYNAELNPYNEENINH